MDTKDVGAGVSKMLYVIDYQEVANINIFQLILQCLPQESHIDMLNFLFWMLR
jgi:hypothetical protein